MKSPEAWSELLHTVPYDRDDVEAQAACLVRLRAGTKEAPIQVHVVGRGRFLRAVAPETLQLHSGTEWLFEFHADPATAPETALWRHFDSYLLLDVCRTQGPALWNKPELAQTSTEFQTSAPFRLFPMHRTFRPELKVDAAQAYVPLIAQTLKECDNAPMIQVRDSTGQLLWPSLNEDGTGEPLVQLQTILNLCRHFRSHEYEWVLDGLSNPRDTNFLVPFGTLICVKLLEFDFGAFTGKKKQVSQ